MHDDRLDAMTFVNMTADQIIREILAVYAIPVAGDPPQTPFQGQVIDSTAFVLDETQRMLPAPVPNNTPQCCKKVDNDEPL